MKSLQAITPPGSPLYHGARRIDWLKSQGYAK
jgi:hypothetical protein